MKNNQPDNILLDLFTEEAAETIGIRPGGGLNEEPGTKENANE